MSTPQLPPHRYTALAMVGGAMLALGTLAQPHCRQMGAPTRVQGSARSIGKALPEPLAPPELSRSQRRPRRQTGVVPSFAQATLLWSLNTGSALVGSPLLDKDRQSYWVTQGGELLTLDPAGRPGFRRSLGGPAVGSPFWNSAADVCAATRAGRILCFDRRGRPKSDQNLGMPIRHAPQPDGHRGLFASIGHNLIHHPHHGPPETLLHAPAPLGPIARDSSNALWVGDFDGRVWALSPSGKVLWRQQLPTHHCLAPALVSASELVYVGCDGGWVFALQRRDGQLRFSAETDGHVRAGMAIDAHGHLWLQTFGPRPTLVALSASSGDLLYRALLPLTDSARQGSWAGLAAGKLGDAALIVFGGSDEAVYALELQEDAVRPQLQLRFPLGGPLSGAPVQQTARVWLAGSHDGHVYAWRFSP